MFTDAHERNNRERAVDGESGGHGNKEPGCASVEPVDRSQRTASACEQPRGVGEHREKDPAQPLKAPYAFWIVCPKSMADLPKISAFRNWLLKEAEDDARHIAALDSRLPRRSGRRAAVI